MLLEVADSSECSTLAQDVQDRYLRLSINLAEALSSEATSINNYRTDHHQIDLFL